MPEDATFSLRSEVMPDRVVVHCGGRLVSSTAETLKADVKPRLVRGANVVLDVTELSYMDSIGLGTIAGLWVSSKTASCQLAVINLSPRIRELFRVTRLLTLFEACGETNARIP